MAFNIYVLSHPIMGLPISFRIRSMVYNLTAFIFIVHEAVKELKIARHTSVWYFKKKMSLCMLRPKYIIPLLFQIFNIFYDPFTADQIIM